MKARKHDSRNVKETCRRRKQRNIVGADGGWGGGKGWVGRGVRRCTELPVANRDINSQL
jgi:hypothetical protein